MTRSDAPVIPMMPLTAEYLMYAVMRKGIS